ncbi:hypothetical protein ABKV19_026837 [Rosa sericea]
MCPVAEDYFCSSSKGSGASIPRFLNFCVETRASFTAILYSKARVMDEQYRAK